jgi:hypothetical protein
MIKLRFLQSLLLNIILVNEKNWNMSFYPLLWTKVTECRFVDRIYYFNNAVREGSSCTCNMFSYSRHYMKLHPVVHTEVNDNVSNRFIFFSPYVILCQSTLEVIMSLFTVYRIVERCIVSSIHTHTDDTHARTHKHARTSTHIHCYFTLSKSWILISIALFFQSVLQFVWLYLNVLLNVLYALCLHNLFSFMQVFHYT